MQKLIASADFKQYHNKRNAQLHGQGNSHPQQPVVLLDRRRRASVRCDQLPAQAPGRALDHPRECRRRCHCPLPQHHTLLGSTRDYDGVVHWGLARRASRGAGPMSSPRHVIYNKMYDIVNITGFLPFGGDKINPTELIVDQLRRNPHPRLRRLQKLDVTVREVDWYVSYLKKSCRPVEGRILNIHMGVGPNQVYFLQQCGYNLKDFPIPDNSGYICTEEPIVDAMKVDEPIKTRLDLGQLAGQLAKRGQQVQVSHDPGRYICNYMYFKSLKETNTGGFCDSLFVHFPDQTIKTTQQNVQFIRDLIDSVIKKN